VLEATVYSATEWTIDNGLLLAIDDVVGEIYEPPELP